MVVRRFPMVATLLALASSAPSALAQPCDDAALFDRPEPLFPVIATPDATALADLDGDGDLDAIVGVQEFWYEWDATQLDWYERRADGHFRWRGTIFEGSLGAWNLSDVDAGDLDGDGDVDLLVTEVGLVVLENLGRGRFAEPVTVGAGDAPTSAALADLDGDRDLDVVSVSELQDQVAWYTNDGSGDLGNRQILATSAGGAPRSVTAADLDGDRDPDVVVGWHGADRVTWFPNRGRGAFRAEQVLTTRADGVEDVIAANLYGSRLPEIVTAGADGVAVHGNRGLGRFEARSVVSTTLDGAVALVAGDVDDDGVRDLVALSTGDRTAWWLGNLGQGAFAAEQAVVEDTSAEALSGGDLDGDGGFDLLVGGAVLERLPECSMLDTDGDGLTDALEVDVIGSDPALADTDGGGTDDGLEVQLGGDPLDPTDDGAP